MQRTAAIAFSAVIWVLLGCSDRVAMGRRCAQNGTNCTGSSGADGGPGAGNSAGASGQAGADTAIGSSDNELSVHVEDIKQMIIEIITIQCAGDCADVVAVAQGGHPPYAFQWEDGSTTATRQVCPGASTRFSVTATDTAITAGEFPYAAHTATAKVTANVLRCSDGGADSSPTASAICIDNPSFEGTAAVNVNNFDVPHWTSCFPIAGADVWGTPGPNGNPAGPTDGKTFVGMSGTATAGESISQALCAPLHADDTYHFEIDLATDGQSTPTLQIFGADKSCATTELLWTSPPLTPGWQTWCVTLTPTVDHLFLTLNPVGPSGGGNVFADHIVPTTACNH